jgi:hypothetical protein
MTRPIDYIHLESVNLGNYDPTQDPYYEKTAYTPARRKNINIVNTADNFIGPMPNYKRLNDQYHFRGDDAIAISNANILILSTVSVCESVGDKTIPLTASDWERDANAYKIEYFPSGLDKSKKYFLLAMVGCYFWSLPSFYFFMGAGVLFFILGLVRDLPHFIAYLEVSAVFIFGGLFFKKVFGYITNKIPSVWVELNRTTGMLHIPRKNMPPADIPFAEFEPRIVTSSMPGRFTHNLQYVHKSGLIIFPVGEQVTADVYLRAAYLEQFMDITQPLPDVPILESYREKDPTTVAYDKANNRNPRYWRDKTKEEIQAIAKAKIAEVKKVLGDDAYRV